MASEGVIEIMTDEQLSNELRIRGAQWGPIVQWTRSVYERKLSKLMAGKSEAPEADFADGPAEEVSVMGRGARNRQSNYGASSAAIGNSCELTSNDLQLINDANGNFAPTPKRASPPRLVKEPPQRRSPSSDRFQAPSPAKDHIEQSIKRAPTPDHAAALTERPVREAAPARYTSAPDSLPHSDVSQVVNNRTDYPDDRPSTSRPFTSIASLYKDTTIRSPFDAASYSQLSRRSIYSSAERRLQAQDLLSNNTSPHIVTPTGLRASRRSATTSPGTFRATLAPLALFVLIAVTLFVIIQFAEVPSNAASGTKPRIGPQKQ